MRHLLDVLYLVVLPIALLARRKHRSGLWSRFLGKSDIRYPISEACRVWFHGVSVGEVHLLRGVVARFRARHPKVEIVISSTTEAGFAEAYRCFTNATVLRWPLDFSWAVQRAFHEIRPDLVVLAESEWWPNFLLAAKRMRIPVVAINVRMSPRSLPVIGFSDRLCGAGSAWCASSRCKRKSTRQDSMTLACQPNELRLPEA